MDYCQERKYEEEIYQLYSKIRLFRIYTSHCLENFDNENNYEKLILNFYSKNSKL